MPAKTAKETAKSKELRKLNDIFENIPENKRNLVEKLIDTASFLKVELEELEKYIAENGVTEEYKNGANQFGKKVSSEVSVYRDMIKNYKDIIKTLSDYLPEESKSNAIGQALMEFALKK